MDNIVDAFDDGWFIRLNKANRLGQLSANSQPRHALLDTLKMRWNLLLLLKMILTGYIFLDKDHRFARILVPDRLGYEHSASTHRS